MAGSAGIYYGIVGACVVVYIHIFVVSKMMQKRVCLVSSSGSTLVQISLSCS